MNYDNNTHQQLLMLDLTEKISNLTALDQAVSVLIEWGFIDAEVAAKYIRELEKENA